MSGLDPQAEAFAKEIAKSLAPMLRPSGPGDLLTVERAADRLGVSPRTVRKMLDERTIPSLKVEGRRVVRPEAVEAYIAAREAEEAA